MAGLLNLEASFFKVISRMFLEKALSWFYNERHHGKGRVDGAGGIIENLIFRKVKFGHVIVNTSSEFTDAAINIFAIISMVYMPANRIISEPEGIKSAPFTRRTSKIQKIVRMLKIGQTYSKIFELACDDESFYV